LRGPIRGDASIRQRVARPGIVLRRGAGKIGVQYNDPDPLGWMAIYLAAAISCAMAVSGRPWWVLPAITAAIAAAWSVTLMPAGLPVPVADLVGAWEMKDERVEVAREMYGLLIVASVCASVAWTQWRGRRS
jgi:hypothetical protein